MWVQWCWRWLEVGWGGQRLILRTGNESNQVGYMDKKIIILFTYTFDQQRYLVLVVV